MAEKSLTKKFFCWLCVHTITCLVAFCVGLLFAVIFLLASGSEIRVSCPNVTDSPNTFTPKVVVFPSVDSSGGPYYNGAVASDAKTCSAVGVTILQKKGSAVDAAIATMLCVGVVNMHSTGIAGGGFMMVYKRRERTTDVVDFREKAPASATEDMFVNKVNESRYGGQAIAVPGEVHGFYKAWKKYGKLKWKELVQPAIDIAKNGFKIGKPVYEAAEELKLKKRIAADPGLKELLFDSENKTLAREGTTITNLKYAATLEQIRDDPHSLYNGTLAKNIVRDMDEVEPKGNLTMEDLQNYTAVIRKGLVRKLDSRHVLHTAPPPTSGPVMNLILNTLKGYNMTSADRSNDNSSSLAYHRILEAFKFAFAYRSLLGDPAFANDSQVVKNMLDPATGDFLRKKIWDNRTHDNISYYAKFFTKVDHGTSHLVVLAPNGDAVSVTSSINYRFGCMYRSTATGIIYNNEMADFDNPGSKNVDGVFPSKKNFPAPGKRPLSSMMPVIITDNEGNVELVTGASGGKKIISATALTIMNWLWFNHTVSRAVDEPRVHTQLVPDDFTVVEKGVTDGIRLELKRLGHVIEDLKYFAAVQAITRFSEDGAIYAKSDNRKVGKPGGF